MRPTTAPRRSEGLDGAVDFGQRPAEPVQGHHHDDSRARVFLTAWVSPGPRSTEPCPRSGGPDPGAPGQRYAAAVVARVAQGFAPALAPSPAAATPAAAAGRTPRRADSPPGGLEPE